MTAITGPVHLVGIGGIHMSAIGQLLLERGVAVTGSDLAPSDFTRKLEAMGATVSEGHAAANVPADTRLLVTTAAAGENNPEIAEARRRGLPVLVRAEMVAKLMEGKNVIAVAGAHGKTTTSSLIAFILSEAGRKPMYLLGVRASTSAAMPPGARARSASWRRTNTSALSSSTPRRLR
jgi:UDP-N-acetylmuramate--alanine ligase